MEISRSMPVVDDETKPYGIIYFILNVKTGKYYVGQTKLLGKLRLTGHFSDAKRVLKGKLKRTYWLSALLKYGKVNFEFREIFRCYDKKTLDEAEIFFIKLFNATDPEIGYNISSGGSPFVAMKGKPRPPRTPEHCANLSASLVGRIHSEEAKKAHNDALRGREHPPEFGEAISKKLTGRKRPEADRQAMRDGWKNVPYEIKHRPRTDQEKAAMRAGKARRKLEKQNESAKIASSFDPSVRNES